MAPQGDKAQNPRACAAVTHDRGGFGAKRKRAIPTMRAAHPRRGVLSRLAELAAPVVHAPGAAARRRAGAWLLAMACQLFSVHHVAAQVAVNATVNLDSTLAVLPEYGMGIHTSVYDNSLWYVDSPGSGGDDNFDLLPSRLDGAGIDVLRYPGGGYADVFHFSLGKSSFDGGMTGHGLSPYWGVEGNYGYMGPKADFGNFIKLLDATQSKTVITVNTGSAIKYNSPSALGIPTHAGQPKEAAAWVAYANADPAIYQTAADKVIGIDEQGNDWKTAGYWAKLRASTASEFSGWATADGVYDARNAFLAINRDAPVGIKYWEIGNESFGTAYYGGSPRNLSVPLKDDGNYHGYALNYAAPYDGTLRDDHPALSPASYGQQVNAFTAAMKAVDPTIKVGAVLTTPRTTASDLSNPIGDYRWSFADLNDDGVKQPSEPYWNDEVLSQTDPVLGKVADNVDFVIAHWYPGGNATTILDEPRLTIPTMINGTTAGLDSGSNAGLRDAIAAWRTDGNAQALEIFLTETDGYGGSTQASDGKFAADAYITFFENGVSNVDYLELHNNQFMAENTNVPNFAYFGIQSVHLLAEPGDRLVATTTTESDVRIHAAVQDDGTIALMVINNNTSSRAVTFIVDGATLAAAGVRFQTDGDTALASANLAGLGNTFSTTVPSRTLQVFLIPSVSDPGDFTSDGLVDGADFLAWQRGESPNSLSAEDLADWVANFGPESTGSAPVPEPPCDALLAIAAAALMCCRPRIVLTGPLPSTGRAAER